jgi:phosphate transport system substrate-binding protein
MMQINKIKMISRIIIAACLVVLIFVFTGCAKSSDTDKPLEVVGTGACEEVLKKFAEAFNKTNTVCEVVIPPSIGSGGGIKAVGNDEYVLGRVARPLKEKEADLGLSYLVFAKDAIVFAVGSDINIKSLTEQQLVDIFTGKVNNWKQVGGSKAPIRVLAREKGDSSRLIIDEHMPEFAQLKYGDQVKMIYHDYEMVDLFSKYPTAIGWVTASSVNSDIHPIAIDGIEPTPQNISSGEYPLAGTYAFVFKKKNLNDPAEKFIDFMFSDEGKKIMAMNGLMSISRE